MGSDHDEERGGAKGSSRKIGHGEKITYLYRYVGDCRSPCTNHAHKDHSFVR